MSTANRVTYASYFVAIASTSLILFVFHDSLVPSHMLADLLHQKGMALDDCLHIIEALDVDGICNKYL